MKNNRCIVMGGSFNPPTVAHEQLMRHAIKCTGSCSGIYVPSSHDYVARKMAKAGPNGTIQFSERARMEMLLAIAVIDPHGPSTHVSNIEYGDDGRGHTFSTMEALKTIDPSRQFCFLLGADKLKILPRWHNIEKFLENFYFVVISRSKNKAKALIDEDPLLGRYSDKFLIIPKLDAIEGISSTKARIALQNCDTGNAAKLLDPAVLNICEREMKFMAGMKGA